MKIIFLGTNGWYSSPTGDTACVLIDSKDHYVIFDAGNGIYKLDQYITEDKPISLFISHFHLDHTSGLHTLNKFDFKQGIDVYVGEGRSNDFKTLVNPPYTIGYLPQTSNVNNLRIPIRLYEMTMEERNIPFRAKAYSLHHAYGGHGYKIELENKKIAYTGDCGITDQANALAKNADLLIAECSNKENPSKVWGHLDPTLAANLAKNANSKQLILTHFAASTYLSHVDRRWAERQARKIFPATTAATDGMEIEI